MVESYFLVICVTLEQEIAIRELFEVRAWAYKQVRKYQEESVHVESSTQTIWIVTQQLDGITETTRTEAQHLHTSHTDTHQDNVTNDTQTRDDTPNETVQTNFHHQDDTPQNLDTITDVSKETQTSYDTPNETVQTGFHQDNTPQNLDTEDDVSKDTQTRDDIPNKAACTAFHHQNNTPQNLDTKDDVSEETQTRDDTPNETVLTDCLQDNTPHNLDTKDDMSKDNQTGHTKGVDNTQKDTQRRIQYQDLDYIPQYLVTENMTYREPHSSEGLETTRQSNIIQNQTDKFVSNGDSKILKPNSKDTSSIILECNSFDSSRGAADIGDGKADVIKQSYSDNSIASVENNLKLTLTSSQDSDVRANMKKEKDVVIPCSKANTETDHLGSYEISPETPRVAFRDEVITVEPFKALDSKGLKNICSPYNDSSEKTVRKKKGNTLKSSLLRPTSLRHKSAAYKRNSAKDNNKSKFQNNDQPMITSKKPILSLSQMKIPRKSVNEKTKDYVMLPKKEKTVNASSNKTKEHSTFITDRKSARIRESNASPKHKIVGKSQQSNRSAVHNTTPGKSSKTLQIKSSEGIPKRKLKRNGKVVDKDLSSLRFDNALKSQIDSLKGDVKAKVLEVFKSGTSDTKVSNSFECFYCHRLFSKKTYFVKHIQRHTKCEFDCPECGKKFKNFRNMNAHRFQRSSKKRFSCDICNHESNTACLLRIHKKTVHPAIDTFFCHLCPKVIRTKSYLNIHLKLTHGIYDGKYECHICGKKSKRHKLFQKHLETHKNPRDDRQCQICEKTFKSEKQLRSHMRVHEDRKHVCNECGKSFTTASKLAGHKRTHTGDKPFQCTQCDYKSTQAGNLRSHMKVHQRYGENKGDSTKPKGKPTNNDTAADIKFNTDPANGPINDHQSWYNNKQSFHQTQTPTVEPSVGGYPGQSMMYTDQGQVNHHYGDDIGCQGDHRYGDQMNFNGPKGVPVNPGPDSQSQMSGMYAAGMGEQGNRYQGMLYNHVDVYTDTYANNQYYNSMDTASYVVQSDNTVTNTGHMDVIVDNTMKPFTVSNAEQVPNIHDIYQQQSSQTMQQQNYIHHHQQQQNQHQHQRYQQQQTLQEHHQHHQQHVLYPLSGTGESVKAHTNDGHSLYGDSQCYTDLGEHSSTTNYPDPNTLESNVCHNDGQNQAYGTDISKSNFTNPNVRIFLGSESGLDSLNFAPYPAVDQSITVQYSENVHQQGYGDHMRDQETYTELQRTRFPNVPTSEMS